jgi:hypothetical protein
MTAVLLAVVLTAAPAAAMTAEGRFREAGEAVRAGDFPKAIALYEELARAGSESPSLYWNWAQAASARGAHGEALWALLLAHDLGPADAAVAREIERARDLLGLDPAEIAPEPLAVLARTSRRFHLDLVGLGLLLSSLASHVAARLSPARRWPVAASWTTLCLGLVVLAVPLLGSTAAPTGVVIRRSAPLLDAASPTANVMGSLREGEVVPLLGRSGDYLRLQDSSGARGWAASVDVRPLASERR